MQRKLHHSIKFGFSHFLTFMGLQTKAGRDSDKGGTGIHVRLSISCARQSKQMLRRSSIKRWNLQTSGLKRAKPTEPGNCTNDANQAQKATHRLVY